MVKVDGFTVLIVFRAGVLTISNLLRNMFFQFTNLFVQSFDFLTVLDSFTGLLVDLLSQVIKLIFKHRNLFL